MDHQQIDKSFMESPIKVVYRYIKTKKAKNAIGTCWKLKNLEYCTKNSIEILDTRTNHYDLSAQER